MAGDVSGTAHENPASPGAPPVPARLALYRRYRPATFAEVKGQEHVTEPLRQALLNGRVHHAYLFSGPRGCGKTSSARILARSLNCVRGPTPDPCGVCDSCIALGPAGAGSIDVIEIDAASHGGVDDARELRERAFYAPVAGRFKVYIIDEAHMVTREGFNALLKLVEEPPPHLKFVFATTEPEKVIPTIRSRTHHYPFRLVPPAVLRGLLEEILAAEGIAYEPSVLPLVVRAGAGSVRDALSVLDQLLAGAGDEGLTYDRTVVLLGFSDDNLLDAMVDALSSGDGAAVFGTVDRVVQSGHDPRRFAADLLDRLRDLIILAAVPGAGKSGLLDAPTDRLDRMTAQAGSFGQAELARAAEVVSEGLIQMRGTTSPRLLLELTCAQILLPGASTSEKALLARVERLERRLEGPEPSPEAPSGGAADLSGPASPEDRGNRPAAPAGPPRRATRDRAPVPSDTAERETPRRPSARAAPASPREPAETRTAETRPVSAAGGSPADAETLRHRWPDVLTAVRAERKVAWLLLQSASVESLEHGVLTLAFPRGGDARGFSGSGHDQVLTGVLATMLGLNVRVKATIGTGAGSARQATGPGRQPGPGDDPAAGPGPTPGSFSTGSLAPGTSAAEPEDQPPAPGDSAPAPGDPATGPEGFAPVTGPTPTTPSGNADAVTGMELIQRQLGGRIIEEIEEP